MKHTPNTKERKAQFKAFVEKYESTIAHLLSINDTRDAKAAWNLFIDHVVRKQIPYSPKTINDDIRMRIIRQRRNMQIGQIKPGQA